MTLLLVAAIQGLEAVSIVGPQSLKVNTNFTNTISSNVPSLDLTQAPVLSADVYSQGYIQPSALWNRIVQKAMISPSDLGITPPSGCNPGCSYKMQYTAPVLKCRDLSASEISISSNPNLIYSGTSSLWTSIVPSVPSTAPPSNAEPALTAATNPSNINYTIRIEWQSFQYQSSQTSTDGPSTTDGSGDGSSTTTDGGSSTATNSGLSTTSGGSNSASPTTDGSSSTGDGGNGASPTTDGGDATPTDGAIDISTPTASANGVECQFFEGNYEASMFFNGTRQLFNTTGNPSTQWLVGRMANSPSCSATTNASNPCWVTATNYRATAEAFAQLLVGQINYDDSGRLAVFGSADMTPLFNTITNIGVNTYSWNFNLAVANLSSALETMFGNATLALIATQTDTTEVDVTFFGSPLWEYDAWLLWAIYAPTLFIFGLFAAHGLWCIRRDGTADSTFSSFLVSTRSKDFDRVVSNAGDLDAVKDVAVTYTKHGAFEVVADSVSKKVA